MNPGDQVLLECDLLALIDRFNTAKDETVVTPSTYLEVSSRVAEGLASGR